MVTVTQLYNFLIVAVTDDSLSLIESKVFFYFAYALFPGLIVSLLLCEYERRLTSASGCHMCCLGDQSGERDD